MYHLKEESMTDETIDIIDSSIDQIEMSYNNVVNNQHEFVEMMEKVNGILFANGLKIADVSGDDFEIIYNEVKNVVNDEIRLEFPVFGLMDSEYSEETNLLLVIRVGKEHEDEPLQFDITLEFDEDKLEDVDDEELDMSDEPFAQVNRPFDLIPGIDS